MGLILPQEVDVVVNSSVISYYENLGYEIPRSYDNQKRLRVKRGQTIKVSVFDLKLGSNVIVKCQCDICEKITEMQYVKYLKNVKYNNGEYHCGDIAKHKSINVVEEFKILKQDLLSYYAKNDKFPLFSEYTTENGFTFTYATSNDICKRNGTELYEVINDIDCFKSTIPSTRYYQEYISVLKDAIDKDISIATNLYTFLHPCNLGIPNIRWLIDNCPDVSVADVDSFKKYLGYYSNYLSKEQCIKEILIMADNANRPLMYDDFRGTGYGKVSIQMIKDYWGSVNKMKESLGLEKNQESMIDRIPSEKDLDDVINEIIKYTKSLGKDFITEREIECFCTKNNYIRYVCINKWCNRYYNMSFSSTLKSFGISMAKAGLGIINTFDDGERTISQFEYMFSTYLRNLGLKYNQDYFRDIRYSSIENQYSGMMNCDYIIKYNENTIYIEIAGFIEMYKQWYYSGKSIYSSKSKEKYRRKLYEKEQMFIRNNVMYFILFPCDITRDICNSILKNPTVALRKEIEKRYKNNIDWKIIQKTGELKYLDELGRDGQPIVDYGEAI